MALTTGRALRALLAAAVDRRAARADDLLRDDPPPGAVAAYLVTELEVSAARRRLERFRLEVHVRLREGVQVPLATAEEYGAAHVRWAPLLGAATALDGALVAAYDVPYDELG